MRAIILAAGRGMRLQQEHEEQLPKCLLPFGGHTLLERHLRLLRKAGVQEVVLALGFRHDLVRAELDRLGWQPRPEIVLNERFELGSVLTVHTVAEAMTRGGDVLLMDADVYAETSELASLACAVEGLESDTVISYGDLLFRSYVLRDLVDSKAEFSVVVDSSPSATSNRTVRDFAYCSLPDDRGLFGTSVVLKQVVSGKQAPGEPASGWFDTLDMPALMNALLADGAQIEVLYLHGHWRGVNDLENFRQAVDFAHSQTPFQ